MPTGIEGAASPESSQSGSKLPLEVASSSSKASNIVDHEMVTAGAESYKVAMVLYESDGDEREHWLGSYSELVKVVCLGSNGES